MKRVVFLFINFVGISLSSATAYASAVEAGTSQEMEYNPNSLHPIPYANILIKKRVWRHIDLREKYNRPLSPYKKELAKFIIEGVKEGLLTPYKDEEFKQPMSEAEFFSNLMLPNVEDDAEEGDDFYASDDWGDVAKKQKEQKKTTEESFSPSEIAILELMEDWIFDKVRSVQVYDIQSIKLIIPADKFDTGLHREIGIFKYKDLAPYFDEQDVNWLNVKNSAGNIKVTEAFALRLFSSRIFKIENPDDSTVADIYTNSPKAAALAAQELEEAMLEEEFFLWQP